mgnify:FL=1
MKVHILLVLLAFSEISCKIKASKVAAPNVYSTVLTDSVFTGGIEGPAVNEEGDLFVVNYRKNGTIGVKKSNADSFKLFLKLPKNSIGNGIRFDFNGDMFIADYVNHNVLKVEKGTKQVEVFSHDSTMNQPNDLTLMDNGIGFTSDPNWGDSIGNLWRFSKETGFELIESNMGTTNGVEVSPDNKRLYVNESIQRKVWSYDLGIDGSVSNKKMLIEFPDFGLDGMRCDEDGNLYIARYGKGVIAVVSSNGKLLYEIKLSGTKPTNVAFDKKTKKTLYVTMQEKKWVEVVKLP